MTQRQYFYLVTMESGEHTFPKKIFLQEHEAVQWGRRLATISQKEDWMRGYKFILYKQEITRTGTLQKVNTLEPYKEEV